MARRHAVFIALVVAAGALYFLWRFAEETRERISQTSAAPAAATPASSQTTPASESLYDRIGQMLATLRGGSKALDLTSLRRALSSDPAAGIAAIRRFLATRDDAATGQRFAVGPDGVLEGAPTLRTFLLDTLGQLSRQTGDGAGAEVGREILAEKISPDEWALALRNIAWEDPKSRPFLAQKLHEMLDYEPWTATPTGGLLEAFDVAVFTGDASFVPTFDAMGHGGNTALQRAATVALDRLAENSPLTVMQYLNSHPASIADLPFVRADYFSKADLGNPEQRRAVETYLDRADVTLPEKTKFLHAIASPGSFVSDSLLSTSQPAGNGTGRYPAIATAATEWARTNRFPAVEEHVLWLIQRVTVAE